jgi:hypothetical protein
MAVLFVRPWRSQSRLARQTTLGRVLWLPRAPRTLHYPDFIKVNSDHEERFDQFVRRVRKLLLSRTFFGSAMGRIGLSLVRHGGGPTFFVRYGSGPDFFGVDPKKVPPFFMPQKSQKSPRQEWCRFAESWSSGPKSGTKQLTSGRRKRFLRGLIPS